MRDHACPLTPYDLQNHKAKAILFVGLEEDQRDDLSFTTLVYPDSGFNEVYIIFLHHLSFIIEDKIHLGFFITQLLPIQLSTMSESLSYTSFGHDHRGVFCSHIMTTDSFLWVLYPRGWGLIYCPCFYFFLSAIASFVEHC